MKNHYDILGIPRSATSDQIKTAYRKLSVKFHPDKNDGEAFFSDMFRQINEAYTVLYDPSSKKAYDIQLYKFEHPEPVNQKVYQQPPATPPKANYSTNYNYEPKDKWASVKKWSERRNAMLIINGVLILIIFLLPKKGSTNAAPPETDSSTYKSKPIVRHHKHKRQIIAQPETPVKNKIDSVPTPPVYVEHIPTPEKTRDSTSTALPKSTAPFDTVNTTPQKRKPGFFKRLFGKKKKDTAQ